MPEKDTETEEKRAEQVFENLAGFFDLAFRVAIREKINIGQFEDNEKHRENNG